MEDLEDHEEVLEQQQINLEKLKHLQEQLQRELLSQVTNCDENSVGEDMKAEILQSLGLDIRDVSIFSAMSIEDEVKTGFGKPIDSLVPISKCQSQYENESVYPQLMPFQNPNNPHFEKRGNHQSSTPTSTSINYEPQKHSPEPGCLMSNHSPKSRDSFQTSPTNAYFTSVHTTNQKGLQNPQRDAHYSVYSQNTNQILELSNLDFSFDGMQRLETPSVTSTEFLSLPEPVNKKITNYKTEMNDTSPDKEHTGDQRAHNDKPLSNELKQDTNEIQDHKNRGKNSSPFGTCHGTTVLQYHTKSPHQSPLYNNMPHHVPIYSRLEQKTLEYHHDPFTHQNDRSAVNNTTTESDNVFSSQRDDKYLQIVNEKEHLVTENNKLMFNCNELQHQLEEYISINQSLNERIQRLQRHMDDFQDDYEARERLVSMLKGQLTTTTSQLKDQEKIIKKFQEKIENIEEELHSVTREKRDMKEAFHQTLAELDDLKEDNSQLETNVRSVEARLHDTEEEVSSLCASLSTMQDRENQYQSTIHQLEDEIRSLRHVNNRLHSQTTHFQFGSNEKPNIPDENKLGFSVSHRKSTPGQRTSPSSVVSSSRKSTPCPRTSPSSAVSSSGNRPLTRRRWLETSEDGFVFGSPNLLRESTDDKENSLILSPMKETYVSPRGQMEQPYTIFSSPAENALRAVRRGKVTGTSKSPKSGGMDKRKQSIDDRVEQRLQMIAEAEKKLVELQHEKEKLESLLQKAPPTRKISSKAKQLQRDSETRLDEVIKEIGATRMILRTSPSWKK